MKFFSFLVSALIGVGLSSPAAAVSSAELYTNQAYQYGRFAARIQFAPGSGVVSSFFLWKDGSEVAGTFWNELDFEKLEGECRVETNAIFGDPEQITPERHEIEGDLCAEYHTYVYEWTPDYIAWIIDDQEVRRDTGEVAEAFREHAASGMQLRFNVWPGDATFGGVFDPSILPVYQYIDWVEYSSYADGAFQLEWREEFDAGSVPAGWSLGSWESPKGLSTHVTTNVGIRDGVAILGLTADDAVGVEGAMPPASPGTPPSGTPSGTPVPGEPPPAPPDSGEPGNPGAPPAGTPSDPGGSPAPAMPDAPGATPGAPVTPTPGGDTPAVPPATGEQPAPQPGSPPPAPGSDTAAPGAAGSPTDGVPMAPTGELGEQPNDTEGCGCRLPGSQPSSAHPWGLALLFGVAFWTRLRSRGVNARNRHSRGGRVA